MIVAPPEVIKIANKSVYVTHLRILSKMDLRVQLDAKSGQLKNVSKTERFSAPDDGKESASVITVNAFEVRLMVQVGVHLIIHLELHLNVHFKIDIKMQKKVHLRMH